MKSACVLVAIGFLASFGMSACMEGGGDGTSNGSEESRGDPASTGDGDGENSTTGANDAGDVGKVPPPFSKPFPALRKNNALWGSLEVELLAARIERGMDKFWTDGDKVWPIDGDIAPDDIYVELDVAVSNRTPRDNVLEPRSTWDLILPDGSRIEQRNVVALSLSPSGRVPVTLRYSVKEDFGLTGCLLELNGQERGVLQPERIPLDKAYKADIDEVIEELEGKTFESTRPDAFSRRRLKIIRAHAGRNSLVEKRAALGEMFVELELDETAWESFGSNVFDSQFRIDVAGNAYPPENTINELIDSSGLTIRIPVVFSIRDDVKEFAVRFLVSSDGDDTEWNTVPVVLSK